MKYKLVAIDMDGTLLDSEGFISNENADTIKRLTDKGVRFVIATGRNDVLVKDYIFELGITTPIIGCNGATVRDLINDVLYSVNPIDRKTVEELFKYLLENDIIFKPFTLKKGYAFNQEIIDYSLFFLNNTYKKPLSEQVGYELIEDIEAFTSKLLNEQIIKIVLVQEDNEKLLELQEKLRAFDGIDIYRASHAFLDIMAKGVSKGSALQSYAEKLGIDREEIVAIGDSENDLSMIKYAGLSVAMENAEELIKENSDFITKSNNESGVSYALKKIFKEI